ncbi:BA14K family protein [Rhizobium sp. ICMP 5592]|nr:BA14K family protein [Rhizobium sp. ICMP 5592]MQB44302.1 BA14K family protein [Rhizobium sp. ICMP 5592]
MTVRRLLSAVSATALSVLLAVSSINPVAAGPIQPLPQPLALQTNGALQTTGQANGVTQVQYRHHRPHYRPHYRPHHRPYYRPGYHHRPGYWQGHRGYRYARPGYRRYNDGWWYPMAAFTAGAIVGGAVARPSYGTAHARWCANRYRSYRASDNTYQPPNGPRRQCVVR